ncbi:DTW domain-containing protein [Nannocystaceae bacterium ST9]
MSGQRRFTLERCEGCGLHLELCACALRPRVVLPFRVIVVQNNRERHKPTNTGRQVAASIVGGELLHWGVLEREGLGEGERPHTAEFDDSALTRPGVDHRLIFPRIHDPDAPEPTLAPELQREHFERKTAIVLLDGTWTQCSRMSRRIAAVESMPAFRLPPGPDSHWGVRTATEASRISTYEAAVRVLEIAGELSAAAAMQEWFDLHSARMQFMKGKRSSPEVPAEWVAERVRRFGRVDREALASLVQQVAGLYEVEIERESANRLIDEILARKEIKLVYERRIITRDEVGNLFGFHLENEIRHIGNLRLTTSKCYDEQHRELYDALARALLAEVYRRP